MLFVLFCWGGEKGEDNKNQCFLFAWRPRRKKKRGACDWPGKLPSPSPLPPSVLTVFLLNGGVFLFLLSFAAATEPAKSIKTVSLRLHHGAGKTTRSARNITQTHRADLKKVWCLCLCVCVCDFVCLCVFVYLAFCLFLCVCAFACLNSPSATLLLILLFPCLSASPPNRLPPPVSPLSSLPRGASPRFVHCSLSLSLFFLPCPPLLLIWFFELLPYASPFPSLPIITCVSVCFPCFSPDKEDAEAPPEPQGPQGPLLNLFLVCFVCCP